MLKELLKEYWEVDTHFDNKEHISNSDQGNEHGYGIVANKYKWMEEMERINRKFILAKDVNGNIFATDPWMVTKYGMWKPDDNKGLVFYSSKSVKKEDGLRRINRI